MANNGANPPGDGGKSGGFFYGWTIVGVCFLSLNLSVGIAFAAYSPLVVAIEEQFGTSRALASSALSIAGLTLGLAAPLVGGLVQKFSARAVMAGGATLVGGGFAAASLADNIYMLLALYGVIGAGLVAMGIVPCSTLVTRWFNAKRGLALGIINLFPGMALFPVLVTFTVANYGLQGALLANAAFFLLFLPMILLVANRPQDRGLEPLGGEPVEDEGSTEAGAGSPASGSLLRSSSFWMLSLGIGMLTGIANMLTVHLMPIMTGAGISLAQGGIVLFTYGMALAFVAPLFGALIDKIGPFRALMLEVAIVILPWVGLATLPYTFETFLVLTAIIGVANGGIVTLHTSTAAKLFNAAQFSKSVGLGYFVKMPFLFAGPPLAGYVFDETGNYQFTFLGGIVTILLVAVLFAGLLAKNRSPATEQPAHSKA